MQRIDMTAKTGSDGVLHLSIAGLTPDQEYEVLVYVHPRITEWPQEFKDLAGSITDETFVRPPQCQHEKPTGS